MVWPEVRQCVPWCPIVFLCELVSSLSVTLPLSWLADVVPVVVVLVVIRLYIISVTELSYPTFYPPCH